MSKIRVYQLARDLDVESKVILALAKTAGIDEAKSHQSTLSDENVEKLRKLHAGESVSPASSKPKTVIRRRRKASDDTPSEAEAEAPVKQSEVETAPAAEEAKKVEAPAVVEREQIVDEPQVELEQAQAVAAEPAETKAVEEEVTPEPAVAAPPPMPKAEPPLPTKRRVESSGATIVRRATPEELENLESSQNRQRQTGKREDHRGTRVTGMGLLRNRVGSEEEVGSAPADAGVPYDDPTGMQRSSRLGYAKDKPAGDEDTSATGVNQPKTKKQRRAATTLTRRALLETAADMVEEVEGDKEVEARVMKGKTVYTPSSPARRRDLKRRKDLNKTQITTPRAAYRVVKMEDAITVGELAKQMSVKASELIKKLMSNGIMATINQAIDFDTATLLAGDYSFEVKNTTVTVDDILTVQKRTDAENAEIRAPIVTVMGHVDHGKTSILDAIKKSDVVSGEAGGITQHIGAYAVEHNGQKITFLDTPGHEAFSTMRSRGAEVTDIVVLVVAADDGVMPQTVEAISHARDADVPLIVAVNKIDKPNINIDRIFTELSEHGVQPEDWGGDTQFVKCSALEGTGLDELLEAILLQAEMLELRAVPTGVAQGAVIEAHLDRGRGPVATVVIQEGELKVGEFVVCGTVLGRVRAMHDHHGRDVEVAGPSQPVEIVGLSSVPMAGDQLNAVADEKTGREIADLREDHARRNAAAKSAAQSLEDLLAKVQSAEVPEVPLIIKADTQGSLEAVSEAILKLNTDRVKNRIVHAAVGGVSESDLSLSEASGAFIVAFNVRAQRGLDDEADRRGVLIRYFSIIYDIVDVMKSIMVGKLPPVVSEVFMGRAEVRKPISVPKIGTVAGSAVTDGKITRDSHCRLIRDDIVVYEGKLGSLRRFKDDVKEVANGYECGISIEGYNDLKEGDVIEAYVLEESAATL